LRGQKGSVYEGGTRVPTLVSWPGKIAARQERTPVFISDWMPTFCQLAGYESKVDLRWDGTDLSRLLVERTRLPERPIYIAGPRWRTVSLRKGNWKLVASEKERYELFDIAKDPSEKTNLADKESQRLKAMLATLAETRAKDNDRIVK
jgi:arylsulfatase A-like enzyme